MRPNDVLPVAPDVPGSPATPNRRQFIVQAVLAATAGGIAACASRDNGDPMTTMSEKEREMYKSLVSNHVEPKTARAYVQAAQDGRRAIEERLMREGKELLEGTFHEPGLSVRQCTSPSAATSAIQIQGSMSVNGVEAVIADCHPCHTPSSLYDHTSTVELRLHSMNGGFKDISFRTFILTETGSFSVEMPKDPIARSAIEGALREIAGTVTGASRQDFQEVLDTAYGKRASREEKQLVAERLIRLLCRALVTQLTRAPRDTVAQISKRPEDG